MTDLPSSFSSLPDQDPHKYFKNILKDFKKEIQQALDIDALQEKMQTLINASKEMKYLDNRQTSIYHKPATTKALTRIWNEFDRYILIAQKNPSKANPQDLLDAIALVESLLIENDIC